MDVYDFKYNNKDYTLVDIYHFNDGIVIELDSDDDIILFFINKEGVARKLSPQEENNFRKKHGLQELNYVTLTVKDIANFEFHSKKMDKKKQDKFKEFFRKRLLNNDYELANNPYVNKRIDKINYHYNAKMNAYASNTVYTLNELKNKNDEWVFTHETVHGIVNKSRMNTYGLIEGITDFYVGKLLPRGNYSQNCQILGEKIQVNDSEDGQKHLVPFAKQFIYGLGSEYDIVEMFAYPHNQIKKFSEIYGPSKTRILNHKINKYYHDNTIDNYLDLQKYMLELIFDEKIKQVTDSESMKNYFEELIDFGLLRGRIDGKDKALEEYYNNKINYLKQKGLDVSKVPTYKEKPFYPCGDCYLEYNKYINESINLRKKGLGTDFQIMYNKDNTCVYIIIDGNLKLIKNNSFDNKRFFNEKTINSSNSSIEKMENGNYLITGPDGISEEVRDTYSNEIIDNYFNQLEERKSVKR